MLSNFERRHLQKSDGSLKKGVIKKKFSSGAEYIGQVAGGEKHGKGVYRFPRHARDSTQAEFYCGDFLRDTFDGPGVLVYKNFARFEGVFYNGRRNGKGKFYDVDGSLFIGEYVDDTKQGEGTLYYPNGHIFQGEFYNGEIDGKGHYKTKTKMLRGNFKNGLLNGRGKIGYKKTGSILEADFVDGILDPENKQSVLTYSNGDAYTGQLKFFQPRSLDGPYPEGEGVYRYSSGDTYEGQFSKGAFEGTGKLILSIGSTYIGDFHEGKMEGKGVIEYESGARYEGQVKDGKPEGSGSLTEPSKVFYKGNWRAGAREGQGELIFENGDRYEGGFKLGLREGQGALEDTTGWIYSGGWREDVMHGKGVIRDDVGNEKEVFYIDGERVEKGDYGTDAEGGGDELDDDDLDGDGNDIELI